MSALFIEVLNMSLSAGCVALIVILIRLLLKKAPKKYSYILWAVVFFRLVCPFTIQLPVSAVPVQSQAIPRGLWRLAFPIWKSEKTVITQLKSVFVMLGINSRSLLSQELDV